MKVCPERKRFVLFLDMIFHLIVFISVHIDNDDSFLYEVDYIDITINFLRLIYTAGNFQHIQK